MSIYTLSLVSVLKIRLYLFSSRRIVIFFRNFSINSKYNYANMTDFDSFSSDSSSGKSGDKELQEFLMIEKQKAQFNAQIHEFNDFCWEKCVDKPSNKLDARTETCLTNCVDRFIDVSLLITNRFAQLLQKSGGS